MPKWWRICGSPPAICPEPSEGPTQRCDDVSDVTGDATHGAAYPAPPTSPRRSQRRRHIFAEAETERSLTFAPLTLRYHDAVVEHDFRTQYYGTLQRYWLGMTICAAFCSLIVADSFVQRNPISVSLLWLTLLTLVLALGLFIGVCRARLVPYVHWVMLAMVGPVFGSLTAAHMLAATDATHPTTITIVSWGVLVLLRPLFRESVWYIAVACLMYLGVWLIIPDHQIWPGPQFLIRLYEICLVNGVGLLAAHQSQKAARAAYSGAQRVRAKERMLARQKQQGHELLRNILPTGIVLKLEDEAVPPRAFSWAFHECSVLVSDIVGFTLFSAATDAGRVVQILNAMFTKFDDASAELHLEKLKTIGDAYVCVGGVPVPDAHHAHKVALLGLRFVALVAELNEQISLALQIRVGVACGPAYAGIIGTNKMAYELFGAALRAAEQMESSGSPMRVQCTEAMAAALPKGCAVEWDAPRERCFVKSCPELDPEALAGDCAVMPYHRDVPRQSLRLMARDQENSLRGSCNPRDEAALAMQYPQYVRTWRTTFPEAELEAQFVAHQLHASEGDAQYCYALGLVCDALLIPILLVVSADGAMYYSAPLLVLYVSVALHLGMLGLLWARPPADPRQTLAQSRHRLEPPAQRWLRPHFLFSLGAVMMSVGLPMVSLLSSTTNRGQMGAVVTLVHMILVIQMYAYGHFLFWHKVGILVMMMIAFVASYFWALGSDWKAEDVLSFFCASCLAATVAAFHDMQTRSAFVKDQQLQYHNAELAAAKARMEQLLYNVLPAPIIERLYINTDHEIVDTIDRGSVLFAYLDFPGDPLGQSGQDAVPLIDDFNVVIEALDAAVHLHKSAEKIKTVPYIVVSGLPDPSADHATALCHLANDMFERLEVMKSRARVTLRIGIHTGKLCAGLLGKTKFIYDVFGDTVNTASRLASNAPANSAQVPCCLVDAFTVHTRAHAHAPSTKTPEALIPLLTPPQ